MDDYELALVMDHGEWFAGCYGYDENGDAWNGFLDVIADPASMRVYEDKEYCYWYPGDPMPEKIPAPGEFESKHISGIWYNGIGWVPPDDTTRLGWYHPDNTTRRWKKVTDPDDVEYPIESEGYFDLVVYNNVYGSRHCAYVCPKVNGRKFAGFKYADGSILPTWFRCRYPQPVEVAVSAVYVREED